MKRILFLIYYISISTLIFSQSEISELFPTLAGLERTYYIYSPYDCTSDRSDNSTTPTKIDTIINDKSYLLFNDFLLREEKNKVLVYSSVYNKDFVLYDYTLEVGDSLQQLSIDECHYGVADYIGYSFEDENGDCYIETKIPLGKIGVKEVSTITLLDGKEYKKWTFSNGFEYVDGMGCISSGDYYDLIVPLAIPTCIIENYLVCASKNGELLYQMSESEMERLGSECKCLNEGIPTDIETITAPSPVIQKIIHEGQFYIIRDGKTYNLMGVEVEY